jgi:hypothetical protein
MEGLEILHRPDVEEVVDAVYDASTDPQSWSRALQKLGDRFDGSPAIIWLQSLPARPSFSAISRLDEALQPVFFERYATPQTNPAIPCLMKSVPGQPFDFVALMGGRNVFHKTEIYADLFAPQRSSASEIDRHTRKGTGSPWTTGRRSY